MFSRIINLSPHRDYIIATLSFIWIFLIIVGEIAIVAYYGYQVYLNFTANAVGWAVLLSVLDVIMMWLIGFIYKIILGFIFLPIIEEA
jgi:hypothetical protein